MVAAGLVFTVMLALVKLARRELDALDVVFWRGLVAAAVGWVWVRGCGLSLRIDAWGLTALRAVLGFASMAFLFAAAKGLGVADLLLVRKLTPMLIGLLAPLLLGAGERSGARGWISLVGGLIGCALLLAPDLALGSRYALMAVAGASVAALAQVCLRALTRYEDPRVVVFYFQSGAMLLAGVGIVLSAGRLPELPSLQAWPALIGIGVSGTVAQVLMTMAYARDRASRVAVATYVTPLWGVLVDIAVFALLPGWNVLAGGALILAAGAISVFGGERTPSAPAASSPAPPSSSSSPPAPG